MSNFTWIPFYKELAQKLLAYKDKQNELIDFLEELKNYWLPTISLVDMDDDGKDVRLDAIDPFTFFATFNRGITDDNRQKIIEKVKTKFNVISECPTDFSGIPVINNLKSWLFSFKKDRSAEDIPSLWKIAENAINNSDDIDANLFNSCLNIKGVGATYLTVGLFWLNPDKFAACDKVITGYLKENGLVFDGVKSFVDYSTYLHVIKNLMPDKPYYELSYSAWLKSENIKENPAKPTSNVPIVLIGGNTNSKITKKNSEVYHSLNQILYGPPGTGKTYNSVNKALVIIDGEIPENRELATNRFRELIKKGQIVFTTFHQSMCYEDFIEGIKPVEPENEGESISYKVIDGIFKQLAINAEFEYYLKVDLKNQKAEKVLLFDDYWNRLIADIESNELTKVKTLSGKFLKIQTVTGQGNLVVKPEQEDALEYIVSYNRTKKLFDAFSDLSKVKNIDKEFRQVIGGSNSTAYWGILNQLKNYEFIPNLFTIQTPEFVEKEYSYDQKKELLQGWNGSRSSKSKVKNYILIIDEINRGNVAQIFGELITLLEEDKRLGRTEELRVTLPYSKQKGFGVPSNLYIVGTMNTADRSVEALDTALRRRFTFIEMPPKYDLPELENVIIKGITLEMIMKTLNTRIEKLLDKDHLIGHSYFLNPANLEDLKKVFHQNIIPLLQEYFYGDFAKIGLVLGEAFFEKNEVSKKTVFARFAHDAADELNEKPVYRLKQSWSEGEFEKAIEEMVNP